MDVSEDALADYSDNIEDLGSDEFVGFADERDFIEKAIGVFDDVEGTGSEQEIYSISKKMDLSPIVEYFSIPEWSLETAELADFLFLVTHVENGDVVDRFTMISQAKYSDEQSTPTFDVKTHQYHLLNHLPVFKLDSPSHNYKHWLSPERDSFKNYVFAGECWAPFFKLTESMEDNLGYSYYDTSDKEYEQSNEPPVLNRMDTFLKRLIHGMLGERIEPGDDIYNLYEIMFDKNSAWPWSSSPNKVPDGGRPEMPPSAERVEDDDSGVGVVQVVVSDSSIQIDDLQEGNGLLYWE